GGTVSSMRTETVPPSVSSTGTTVSAPAGIGPPVMMRTAWPGPTARRSSAPAATSAITGSVTGTSAMSLARTAYPAMAGLANGGSGTGEVTSSARVAPSACSRSSSSGASGRTVARMSARCASTDFIEELSQPGEELGRQVGPLGGELHDGAQVVELVAGVVAAAAEQHAVHGAALVGAAAGEGAQRVGELDLVAAAGRGVLQHGEDLGVEHVTPDDRPVGRRLLHRGLLDQVDNLDDVFLAGRLDGRDTVQRDLLFGDLHERDDAAAEGVAHLDHALQQRVTPVDEVVAEQAGERVVADVLLGAEHRVAEPLGLALPYVVKRRKRGRFANLGQPVLVALGLQHVLQLVRAVEVVFDRPLVLAGDHQHVEQASGGGLLDDILDGGLVDDRQHLFGCRLGRRKEPGAQTRGGHDGFRHRVEVSHAYDPSGGTHGQAARSEE